MLNRFEDNSKIIPTQVQYVRDTHRRRRPDSTLGVSFSSLHLRDPKCCVRQLMDLPPIPSGPQIPDEKSLNKQTVND